MPANLVERLRKLVILDEVGSDNPLGREAAAEIERLEAERDEATVYARNFLVSFVNRYCDPIAEWAPLPDLIGMLTQIDNAATIAGVFRNRAESAEALCDKLAEALRPIVDAIDRYDRYYDELTGCQPREPDEEKIEYMGWLGEYFALFTVGDLRRAREALEQVGKR